MANSPYSNTPTDQWGSITQKLVNRFKLSPEEIVDVVHEAWVDLYESHIGSSNLVVGKDIFLPAQATGVILEKLIASTLNKRYPELWTEGYEKTHKDIINLKNDFYSFEIKTSSSPNGLYGNRSTGFRSKSGKKVRSGYYLVINYLLPKDNSLEKKIRKIRFGWIDDADWVGQKKSSGQQASIGAKLAKLKLVTLYMG